MYILVKEASEKKVMLTNVLNRENRLRLIIKVKLAVANSFTRFYVCQGDITSDALSTIRP